MRLLINLRARTDATYCHNFHHQLRGRIWQALKDTEFESEHDDGQPLGLSFSGIFPWGDIQKDDERSLLIASPREPLITAIAEDLIQNTEFNIGDMLFNVEDISPLHVDVGEPGTHGVIETATGVVVRLTHSHREQYGIESKHNAATYWQPEHTIEPLRNAIQGNLQHKHDRFAHNYQPGPEDVNNDLFEGYNLIKTYALPVTVTEGTTTEIVVSKWRLNYRVIDDDHRRHLNLALNTGIGGRNALGFGFVNIVERTKPDETELEDENAFA